MAFPKQTTCYGQRAKENRSRYERAKREWDNRIGSARVQAFHWRLIALLALAGMIALGVTLGYVAVHQEVKTFVIETDQLGQPARVSLLDDRYRPDKAQSGYFVAELVRLVRARPLDPVVLRQNWKRAYAFLAGTAVKTMNEYARTDPPLRKVDGRGLTRTVSVTNVLQQSEDAFQVRWQETDYVGGVPQRPQRHSGLFKIEVKPPRNEADVFRNPLGIYVISFSWSKEFTEPISVTPEKHRKLETQEAESDESQN